MGMLNDPNTGRVSMGRVSGWSLIVAGAVIQISQLAMMWMLALGKIQYVPFMSEMPAWGPGAMMVAGGICYAVTKFKAGPVEIEAGEGRQ
jgi:hypothetical protein